MNKPTVNADRIKMLQEPLEMIDCEKDPVLKIDYNSNDYDEDIWDC